MSNTIDILSKNAKIENKKFMCDHEFIQEILMFKNAFSIKKTTYLLTKEIMRTIQACLSGYFIKQAYEKLRTNRLEKFRQI